LAGGGTVQLAIVQSARSILGATLSTIVWKDQPDEHDYPAAAAYLSLVATDDLVGKTISALTVAPLGHFKAKDILRASQLALLPADNQHVAADIAKVNSGKPLSPVLLVRGALSRGFPLQIADGYHRVCASYHLGENNDIPCRIAELPAD
jgi:hypothetical protein